jgi:hypothetical protein
MRVASGDVNYHHKVFLCNISNPNASVANAGFPKIGLAYVRCVIEYSAETDGTELMRTGDPSMKMLCDMKIISRGNTKESFL